MAATYKQVYSTLTPFQQALMEALVARHRLGEPEWPFGSDAHTVKAVKALADKGLVSWNHGIVEHSIRVRLTEFVIGSLREYKPPVLARVWREGYDAAKAGPANPYEGK